MATQRKPLTAAHRRAISLGLRARKGSFGPRPKKARPIKAMPVLRVKPQVAPKKAAVDPNDPDGSIARLRAKMKSDAAQTSFTKAERFGKPIRAILIRK